MPATQPKVPLVGVSQAEPQSFPVRYQGTVGVVEATVTVAPRYEWGFDGRLWVRLGPDEVRRDILRDTGPADGDEGLQWASEVQYIRRYVNQCVQRVRATFDNGVTLESPNLYSIGFDLPPGATDLVRIEVEFSWRGNERTLAFAAGLAHAVEAGFAGAEPGNRVAEAGQLQTLLVVVRASARRPGNRGFLDGRVVNLRTQEAIGVRLDEDGDEGVFVSWPFTLVPAGLGHAVERTLGADPGDALEATVGGLSATLRVTEAAVPPGPSAADQRGPVLRLRAVGPTKVDLRPQPGQEGEPLRVRLRDDEGAAMQDEPIVWAFRDHGAAFVTYTDQRGEARLDFAAGRHGLLTPVVDGLPMGLELPDGPVRVEAVPRDPLLAMHVEGGPVAFEADCWRPTSVEFLDERRSPPADPVAWRDVPFFLRVRLGRQARQAHAGAEAVTVALAGSTGGSLSLEARRTAVPGVFETDDATPVDSGVTLLTRRIKLRRGASLTATCLDGVLTVPFHLTPLDALDLETSAALAAAASVLDGALASGADAQDRALLERKQALLRNAAPWEEVLADSGIHRVRVRMAYLQVVQESGPALLGSGGGSPLDAIKPHENIGWLHDRLTQRFLAGQGRVAFLCVPERQAVMVALRQADAKFWAEVAEVGETLAAQVEAAGRTLRDLTPWRALRMAHGLAVDVVEAGLLGGYAAVTGWTVDGRAATLLERILGGLDALVLLAPVGGLGLRMVDHVTRSARALALRAAVADGVAAAASFHEAMQANSALALSLRCEAAMAEVALDAARGQVHPLEAGP